MKKINRKEKSVKKSLLVIAGLMCTVAGFAQTNQSNQNNQNVAAEASGASEIELEDLSTVVKSGSLTAENDALPSFADVVEKDNGSGSVVPVLPDMTMQEKPGVADGGNSGKEKSIFAEGKAGGGYPSLFYGNFSVYRLTGQNPFKIGFDHNSAAGYSGNSLNDGYKDSTTEIKIYKGITGKKAEINLNGSYKALVNGLQGKASGISDVTQNDVNASGDFTWNFNKTVSAGFKGYGQFYNHYSDITGSGTYSDFIKKVTVLDFEPEIFTTLNFNQVKLTFDGKYTLESNSDKSIAFNSKGSEADKNLHRGIFGGSIVWSNDFLKLYGGVSALLGSHMNDNFILAPFNAGIAASMPVSFSSRRMTVEVQGGLESKMAKVSELEQKYKFAGFSFIPEEESSWFGKGDVTLPFGEALSLSADVKFAKTAFGNGRWLPDYSLMSNGFYGFKKCDITQVYTDFELTYFYKVFTFAAGLKSNWGDIPALEYNHLISATIGVQQKESKCGLTFTSEFGLDEDNNPIVPLFNLDGFVKVSGTVRLGAEVNDIIKLVSGGTRTYAGDYIERSGTASLYAKFFF